FSSSPPPPPPPPPIPPPPPPPPPNRRPPPLGPSPRDPFPFPNCPVMSCSTRTRRSGLLRRLLLQAFSLDSVACRSRPLRCRAAGLVHVARQLHVLLDWPGLGVHVVGHLHAEPPGDLVEVAEVALHLRDQCLTAEVRGVDVDGPGLLGHRVHRLLLAPHREADQFAALAVDDGPDAVLEPVHALVGEVGLDQEDGLVLAQVMRRLLSHVFLPLGLCPGTGS